jgi:hypothetical protein
MEYIGGRNNFRSEDETLLSRERVDACAESWPAGVGVVTVDVDSARSFDSRDSTCKEDDARGEETRSGRANFIWLVSDPTARAASLKCARLCVMEEADDRCEAWDRKELTDGSELPEETRVGESVGSVLGLFPNEEGTNLPAMIGFPTRFWTIRGGASIEIEDRTDDLVEATAGVSRGSGWSSGVGNQNFALNVKVEPFPGSAVPSILPP